MYPLIAAVVFRPPKPFISPDKPNGEPLRPENPLKLNGLYKKFGFGYRNGSEPAFKAAADAEPNSPLEFSEFLFLEELLLDFPELFPDFSFVELLSELSFLSDDDPEKEVPVRALELGVRPGRLKLGNPNNGLPKPIPASPPNGKNIGGAFDEELLEEVVVVFDPEVALEVDFNPDEEVVVICEEAVDAPEVESINIFIDGKPAANRLALNELRAAEDG